MSQSETIARPYAKAVYRQAIAQDNAEQWQQFLHISALIAGEKSVSARLSAPAFYIKLQSWIEDAVFKQRKIALTKEEKNFINLLYENDRFSVLKDIAEQYDSLLNEAKGICRAKVYTAKPLTAEQASSIATALKEKINREVVLDVVEQEDLLAGVRIEYDGLVIDQTTKGRMAQFARKLDDLRN